MIIKQSIIRIKTKHIIPVKIKNLLNEVLSIALKAHKSIDAKV